MQLRRQWNCTKNPSFSFDSATFEVSMDRVSSSLCIGHHALHARVVTVTVRSSRFHCCMQTTLSLTETQRHREASMPAHSHNFRVVFSPCLCVSVRKNAHDPRWSTGEANAYRHRLMANMSLYYSGSLVQFHWLRRWAAAARTEATHLQCSMQSVAGPPATAAMVSRRDQSSSPLLIGMSQAPSPRQTPAFARHGGHGDAVM